MAYQLVDEARLLYAFYAYIRTGEKLHAHLQSREAQQYRAHYDDGNRQCVAAVRHVSRRLGGAAK